MKKKLFSLTVLLVAVMVNVDFVQAQARQNNDWFQRQQQQQRMLEQQRQQQMREQQRQQMQERMRQQMRQEAQQQMRQRMLEQQRLQRQQQMRQGVMSGPGNATSLRGTMNNRSGFTGKSTRDGRAVAVINNRMVAVPNARAGLRASNDNFRKAQTARLTTAQRASISAEVRKLATVAGGGNGGRSTGGGGSAGGGRRRGGNGSGGGGDRSGGNGPSGPNKGDLTKTFNDAAGSKKKKPPEKPTPRPTPRPSPRLTPRPSPRLTPPTP